MTVMSPSYCLRYLAACFLVLRNNDGYRRLRSCAMSVEIGGPNERAIIVEALQGIVARFSEREREGNVTKSTRRTAGIWKRALREAQAATVAAEIADT